MGILLINKKTGKTLVLFDTCSYEAILKHKEKGRTREAIKLLFAGNHIGVITDLSFAELVAGRKTLDEYNVFRERFLSLGFGVFGHSEILSTIGADALNNSFSAEEDYQKFREKIAAMKKEIERPLFKMILLKYTVLFFTVFAEYDVDYFSPLVHLATEMLSSHFAEMDEVWSDIFDLACSASEKEQKECLYNACVLSMEAMAATHKPGYIDNEITARMTDLNALDQLSKYTAKAISIMKKKKGYKEFAGLNNLEFLLALLSINKQFSSKEDRLEYDGTSYSAIMSGFCQGKFQYNDLVDIYNASFIANAQEPFIYITEEERWNRFIQLEKEMGRL